MNQSERYKVNRKRTLQAILRAYRPAKLGKWVLTVDHPEGFSRKKLELSRTIRRHGFTRKKKYLYGSISFTVSDSFKIRLNCVL